MTLLLHLKPVALVTGRSGFARYVGAQFAEDLVVFENIRYGNAAYIMFENRDQLSRRSRVDLVRSDERFIRLAHTSGWKSKLRSIVNEERRKRRRR